MIKVILFDIGGVVVTDGFYRAAPLFAKKIGIDEKKIFDAYIKTDDWKYSAGIIGKERWTKLFNLLKVNVNINEYISLWHTTFKPIHETIQIIKNLKKKYTIGCLSDQPKDIVPYLKKIGVLALFDIQIISCQVKNSKEENNFKIYEKAFAKSKVDKKEILFIDNSEKNINKAKKFGFNVLHYQNPQKLKSDLIKIKII